MIIYLFEIDNLQNRQCAIDDFCIKQNICRQSVKYDVLGKPHLVTFKKEENVDNQKFECNECHGERKIALESKETTTRYCIENCHNIKEAESTICERAFISFSHTDKILAIALSLQNVGVDIEKIDRKIGVVQSIEKWTKIEAYSKYLGTGLSKNLINSNGVESEIVCTFYINKKYCLSVCGQDNDIKFVGADEVQQLL